MLKNLRMILIIVFVIAICLTILLRETINTQKTDFVMDTIMTINAKGVNSKNATQKAFDRTREIEARMTAHNIHSDLSTGILHSDTKSVIERGLYFSEKSGGLFDISIKPLVDLWDIQSANPKVPNDLDIKKAMAMVDYKKVKIDGEKLILPQGMSIDLGAIAKGYGADEATQVLRDNGIKDAIVDIGGDVVVIGTKKVGIQNPIGVATGEYMGIIEVTDGTVVTSGSYERNFIQDGKLYHHILNPYTGYPSDSGLLSATIIGKNSMDADAMATIVFMMGNKGLEFAKQMGVQAMTIDKNNIVRTTGDFSLVITDDKFKLEEKV